MGIAEFIYNKATTDLWANPHGDRQVIFKTVRLTKDNGALGVLDLPFNTFILPNQHEYFSVYELGGVIPEHFGITERLHSWTPMRDIVNSSQTLVQIFTKGRMSILNTSYIQVTNSKNVIIAIAHDVNSKMISAIDPVYVRFYTNIYHTGASIPVNKKISTGVYVNDPDDVGSYISFITATNTLSSTIGTDLIIYLDGLYLPDGIPAQNTLEDGAIIEYIADPFITKRNSFVINDLEAFTSIVDTTNKVIVSLSGTQTAIYVDDLEFYITGIRSSDGLRVGAYYPRLNYTIIRMLTFKDWALNAGMITDRTLELTNMSDTGDTLTDIQLQVIHRNNGEERPTVLDSNRMTDLMNLPLDKRTEALTGVHATLDIWKATSLETCPLVSFLGTELKDLLTFDLTNLYSRAAIYSELERVRYSVSDTSWVLPSMASNGGGDLMTFDGSGKNLTLLNYSALDHSYEPYANGVGYELFLPGYKASDPLDLVVPAGETTGTVIENGFGIFCYYYDGSELVHARYGFEYALTEDTGITTITWIESTHQYERYVRTAQKSVSFTTIVTLNDLLAGVDIYNGRAMTNDIGMGHLYVWAAGNYMIEGLDYHIKNSLLFLRSNHAYINDTTELKILYLGLPNASLQHESKGIWGWVKYGKLSVDNNYNLMSKRNNLFTIAGAMVPGNVVNADEQFVDLVDATNFVDGSPFSVTPIVEFSRSEEVELNSSGLAAEQIIDDSIESYVTTRYPQAQDTGLIAIVSKYDLVSQFMALVIDEMLLGNINANATEYSDERIALLTASYVYLIDDDVTTLGHDLDFVEIHPRWDTTSVDVTAEQYIFINRVNTVMLADQVTGINLYLTIV